MSPARKLPHIAKIPLQKAGLQALVASCVLLIVCYPFLENVWGGLPLNVFVTGILLSGIYAVRKRRQALTIALIVGVPALGESWLLPLVRQDLFEATVGIVWILFYLYTALAILFYILKADRVSSEHLYGAAAVYLLFGLAWASLYSFIEFIQPGSLQLYPGLPSQLNASDFIYFSFSTLTTVGYGDIFPVTPALRMLTILEGITGILYIGLLVSRLVGLQIGGMADRKAS